MAPLGLRADGMWHDTRSALSITWLLQVRGYELPDTDPKGQANRQENKQALVRTNSTAAEN